MSLYDILACPACRVRLARDGDGLACGRCGTRYPIVDGVPVVFPGGATPSIEHETDLAVRQGYDPWVHRIILQSLFDNHVVVDIGSGNMALDDPCIIRMDTKLSPHVDLVADAHALPFLPGSVDFIFSLAVVEHLRNPFLAAQSMHEVLRDGGFAYHECNFVFAYHGYPHHYFNASQQGMEQVFADFVHLRKGVATYQMPSFALDMVLRTYLSHSRANDYPHGRRIVRMIELMLNQDLTQYDIYFTEKDALAVAAGTYLAGMKQVRPGATLLPGPIVDVWRGDDALQKRFPDINRITEIDNFFAWARTEGSRTHPEIARHVAALPRFNKRGSSAPWDRSAVRSAPLEPAKFGAIGYDADAPMAERAASAGRRAAPWRLTSRAISLLVRMLLRLERRYGRN